MGSVCFELRCVLGLAPDAIMMVANRRIVIVLNECTIKSRYRPRKSPETTLLSPEVAAGCHVVVPGSRCRMSRCRPRKSRYHQNDNRSRRLNCQLSLH